jgi:ribonuclease HI
MEALAIRDGVILALERGNSPVTIESDSKEIVSLCNGDKPNRSELIAIWQEIGEIMRAFSSFSISYIGRDANHAAH